MDKEAGGIGKTDFLYKLRIVEKPSTALSDWMREDLILELWETRPRVQDKKLEDGTDVKEVVMDSATNKPVIDKRLRGVSF